MRPLSGTDFGHQAALSGLNSALRGVRSARTAAPTNNAKTSPHRCPLCSEFAKDCTAMIPPCTTLDQTVNFMRRYTAAFLADNVSNAAIITSSALERIREFGSSDSN
jgi:hypothetical protein